ncbi:hypothetical protein D9M72_477170 [compost metagenome]
MPSIVSSIVSSAAPYPAFSIALTMSADLVLASKRTSARSVARLTEASVTPGTARIAFSTRETQDAQVMPSTGMLALSAAAEIASRSFVLMGVTDPMIVLLSLSLSQDGASNDGKVKGAAELSPLHSHHLSDGPKLSWSSAKKTRYKRKKC